MMVLLDFLYRFYQSIIMIGHVTWFFAAVCLCAEVHKHMKDWPKYLLYPIIAICFLSIALPAAEGYAQFFPSEERIRESEEESESIQESIEQALENAYIDGYNAGYETGIDDASE